MAPSTPRKSINLLIKVNEEPERVTKLNKVLPIVTGISVVIFLILFLSVTIYTTINLRDYEGTKQSVAVLEKKIKTQSKTEEVYTLSAKRLETIESILKPYARISPLIGVVMGFKETGINITASSVDIQGNVIFTFTSPSYEQLNTAITLLLEKENEDKLFSQIRAQGITRDKTGKYQMTISLKAKLSPV